MSNLFYVDQGKLHTAILDHCGVAGIMRSIIIDLATQHHLSVCLHHFGPETLLAADEAFICNAVIGIWPIRQLETRRFPLGPITQRLQHLASTLPNGY